MALEEAEPGHGTTRPNRQSRSFFRSGTMFFFACGFHNFHVFPEERLNVTLFGLSDLASWLAHMVEIYSARKFLDRPLRRTNFPPHSLTRGEEKNLLSVSMLQSAAPVLEEEDLLEANLLLT